MASKFKIGDFVEYRAESPKFANYDGSIGVVIGKGRKKNNNGDRIFYPITWLFGPCMMTAVYSGNLSDNLWAECLLVKVGLLDKFAV